MDSFFTNGFDGFFDFTESLTPDAERRLVVDPFGVGMYSPQKKNVRSKRDSFVLLVMNVPQKDGKFKQKIREFSHPVDFRAVEDWTDLYDTWFFEVTTVPLRSDNWNEAVEGHFIDRTRTLRHTDLRPERCYLVCGYTFDDDEHIPVFDVKDIYSTQMTSSGSPNMFDDDDDEQSKVPRMLGLNEEQEELVNLYMAITESTVSRSIIALTNAFFDLKRALKSHYRRKKIVPSEYVAKQRGNRGSFFGMIGSLVSLASGGSKSVFDADKYDDEDKIIITRREIIDPNLNYMLLVAVMEGDNDRLKAILSLDFIDKKFVDGAGQHVLHFNAMVGGYSIFQELMKHEEIKSLINQPDWRGNTPLRNAITRHNSVFLRTIINFMIENKIPLIENTKKENQEPLLFFAMLSDIKKHKIRKPENLMVMNLLKFDNIQLVGNASFTPATLAVMNRRLDLVMLLGERDSASLSAQGKEEIGMTPLLALVFCASKGGSETEDIYATILEYLLLKKIDIHIKDEESKSAVDYCRDPGSKVPGKVKKILLQYFHRTFSEGGIEGMTQEMLLEECLRAIYDDDDVIFEKYFKAVSDPGHPIGTLRNSLLHHAVDMGRTKIVKNILAHPNIKEFCGKKNLFDRSPSYDAKAQNRTEILALLSSKGLIDSKEFNNYEMVSFQHLMPNRNLLGRSISINEKKIDSDDNLGLSRFTVWDSRGNGSNKDSFDGIILDERLMEITIEEFSEYRRVLPSIYLSPDQAYPSAILPSHISFDHPKGWNFEYQGVDLPDRLQDQLQMRDIMTASIMGDKTYVLRNYLGRIDRISQLSHILVILHHLGMYHLNVRPTSILKPKKYDPRMAQMAQMLQQQQGGHGGFLEAPPSSQPTNLFDQIALVNFGCEAISAAGKLISKKSMGGQGGTGDWDLFRRPSLLLSSPESREAKKLEDEVYTFSQIVAMTLYHKPISALAMRRIHSINSEEKLTDLMLEVLGANFYGTPVEVRMIHFLHEISRCMRAKPDEMRRKFAGHGGMDRRMEIEINNYADQANRVLVERNQVLYQFTYSGNKKPMTFRRNVRNNFERLFEKILIPHCERLGIPNVIDNINELKTYMSQFISEETTTTPKSPKTPVSRFSKKRKKKKEDDDDEEEEETEGEGNEGLPPKTIMLFLTLISHAKKRGGREVLWFPILDLLRILVTIPEFRSKISTDLTFKVLMKSILEAEIEGRGGKVNLPRFLCNLMSFRGGRDLLFQKNHIGCVERIICSLLESETEEMILESCSSLLFHLARSSHLYFGRGIGGGRAGLPLLQVIRTCFDFLAGEKKRDFQDDRRRKTYTGATENLMISLYTFMKFRHGYKKYIMNYAERRKEKTKIVAILMKLELFFVANVSTQEDKIRCREIIVSIGAMLLPSQAWLSMKSRMFRAGLTDPFRDQKIVLKGYTKQIRHAGDGGGVTTRALTGGMFDQSGSMFGTPNALTSSQHNNNNNNNGRRDNNRGRRKRGRKGAGGGWGF